MSRFPLPPLDAHAHIQTSIASHELDALDAAVLAVTREPAEWEAALERRDLTTGWGIGCHPGVAAALDAFSESAFDEALQRAFLVGEVGLDGRARTSKAAQQATFTSVLRRTAATPRPVTVHSTGASAAVLDVVAAHPQRGIILHWWRGSPAETHRAIDLGCWFSLNGAEAANPKVVDALPAERVLTETDFPHTRRSDEAAKRPGAVTTVEGLLGRTWGLDDWGVRRQVWRNFHELLRATGTAGQAPRQIRRHLLAAG